MFGKNPTNIKFNQLLYYFTAYSFVGWCLETIFMSASKGYLVKRGFLNGPFLPVYGFGALLLILVLYPYRRNLLVFFAGTIILTSAVEYAASVFLEVVFNKKLWDYSTEPLNINGRVCLKFSVFWCIAALVIINFLHPVLLGLFERFPLHVRTAMTLLLVSYFVIDLTAASVFSLMPENTAEQPDTIFTEADNPDDFQDNAVEAFYNTPENSIPDADLPIADTGAEIPLYRTIIEKLNSFNTSYSAEYTLQEAR